MAHPLTQHPPNMLGFGAPAAMSPLGFGFGQPTPGSGHSSPARTSGVTGFGFGSPGPSMALKRQPPSRGSPLPSPAPQTPHASTKRSRRASSSPSTSPSPLGSPSLSNRRRHDGDEDLERRERKFAGKAAKRIRKDAVEAPTAPEGPDVGLLLASFPPSAHLPILLELLNENPSLAPRVLERLPQPPLANCLETLERIVTKIGKAAGSWESQEGYVATRRWNRVEDQVSVYEKTASTYIKFFTPTDQQSCEHNTIYHLLHQLTTDILQILALVPPGPPQAARPFLDLANQVLTCWTTWVARLSNEVNQRGAMYPHTTVSAWAEGLDTLAHAPEQQHQPTSSAMPSWSTTLSMPVRRPENPMVEGFRHALQPIRERFANELGWLTGRR